MNPSVSTFSRSTMALVSFTLTTMIYAIYAFMQTENLVRLAIPGLLLLISLGFTVRQRREQKEAERRTTAY